MKIIILKETKTGSIGDVRFSTAQILDAMTRQERERIVWVTFAALVERCCANCLLYKEQAVS